MFKKIFGVLQQVGKALMLPVAILPAAGLLLAFGNLFQGEQFLTYVPMLNVAWFQTFASVIEKCGDIVFANLPLLFAVGVAVGLAGGEGVAGLAAIVGFLVMNVTMGQIYGVTSENIAGSNGAFASVLGIPTLQTGVFGGIIIGIVAAQLYKKFYNIQLPSYLGFFAGKRFVPIITALTSIGVGIILVFIWPYIQMGLNNFSRSMIDANPTLAALIFGITERALIPFGLHHIFYNPFWYQFGEYINSAGQVINGDQSIFMAQLKDGVPFTAGTFMTGKYPFMMFGLPAAALAIYQEAKPEKKKIVAGIMGSAALTSFLTGITEPIEFSFLFVAPVLFGVHCVFAGISFMLMSILGVKIGMTFSGGLIDFILFGVIPGRTPWWLAIIVGIGFAVVYYFGFRFLIRKFNLKTPGREDESEEKTTVITGDNSLAYEILMALGGKENIKNIDACITRLRVQVNDSAKVDKDKLKGLGASGVMEIGNNIQVIFGPKSDQLKSEIKDIMSGKIDGKRVENITDEKENKIYNKNTIDVAMPVAGKLIDLGEVDDEVFSGGLMGPGFAIMPTGNRIVSPIDGKIVTVFNTKHAVTIQGDNGIEVLIHVGLDTVALEGKGFTAKVKDGDIIKAGDVLLNIDLDYLKKNAKSTVTPVIFMNLTNGERIIMEEKGNVKEGEKSVIEIKQ